MATSLPSPDDASAEDDRPGAALTGQLLHQRAPFRSPGPGGRIDELDATTPDHSEEDDVE